jgi:hypothetical protein
MRRQWVLFVCPIGVEPVAALEAWYKEDGRPDWPFVSAIAVAPELQHYRLLMEEQDPYTRAFYIFYSFRKLTRTVTVWGGISWQQADRLQGHIDLWHDLMQSRVFPLPSMSNRGYDIRIQLPLAHARAEASLSSATYPELMHELEVVMGISKRAIEHNEEFCAFFSLLAGAIESKLGTLYSIAGTTLDLSVVQRRFHAASMAYTQGWLKTALSAANEASILAALPADQLAEKAGVMDRQHFMKRWPGFAPPDWVILVPAEHIAAITAPFCMQKGGIYRICYKDAYAWVWHMYDTQTKLLASHPTPAVWRADTDQGLLADLTRRVVLHYSQHTRTPQQQQQQQQQQRGQGARFDGESFAIDGEQALLEVLPPCLHNIVSAEHFPVDAERWPLVAALQRAGVDEASVAAWFEAKNKAYPHPKIRDARARWNYEYAWRAQRGPRPCKKFVEEGQCPFVTVVVCSSTDIEELTRSCQSSCAPNERIPFSGPHNLTRRALYRRKSLVLPPSPTLLAAASLVATAQVPEEEQDDVETLPEPSSEDVTEPSSADDEEEEN